MRLWRQQPALTSTGPGIPAKIVVGVTGHRKLDNQAALADAVRSAIESIKQMVPPLQSTSLFLCVLSPLAEGADRLVAQEIIKVPNSMLEVVLPLEKDDYMQDFETIESKGEFEQLLSQASTVRVLPPRRSRNEAYEQVGRYVVDQCDVLIALWNGETATGQGGTGEIIEYARENRCPLVWVHTADARQVTVEPGRGLILKAFQDLDEYNAERLSSSKFDRQLRKQLDFFTDQLTRARLPLDRSRSVLDYMLRHYVRGDLLALRYQHLHYRAESTVYVLAVAAVIVAAFQVLFLPGQPLILTFEVLFMVAVLAILGVSRRQRWHGKWIDYRFLAERFRSALFMALTNADVATLRPPPHLSLAYSPNDWMVAAFSSVWRQRPPFHPDTSLFKGLNSLLCEAWVEDQIGYHEGTTKRHYRRHRRLVTASYVLFGLTIVAALLHLAGVGTPLLGKTFAFMAIALPGIAASLTAVRVQRDYLRNSMRSAEMARHLKELKHRTMRVQEHEGSLSRVVKEIEETMLHENEDWRVVIRFHTSAPV